MLMLSFLLNGMLYFLNEYEQSAEYYSNIDFPQNTLSSNNLLKAITTTCHLVNI